VNDCEAAAGRGERSNLEAETEMTRGTRKGQDVARPGTNTGVTTDRIAARPDGYYWVADDGEQEFGPFATAALALAAANEVIETKVEETQALQDAEAEIGVAERQDRDIVEVDDETPRHAEGR
jgi:hypothetical protein